MKDVPRDSWLRPLSTLLRSCKGDYSLWMVPPASSSSLPVFGVAAGFRMFICYSAYSSTNVLCLYAVICFCMVGDFDAVVCCFSTVGCAPVVSFIGDPCDVTFLLISARSEPSDASAGLKASKGGELLPSRFAEPLIDSIFCCCLVFCRPRLFLN